MILVSACLVGFEVRYNGTHCLNEKLQQLLGDNKAIAVCPEILGGFSTPREPAEIIGGNGFDVLEGRAKVIEKSGGDVTELYMKGAYVTLQKAQDLNAKAVILKEFSPSCGSSMIYNGTFENKQVDGVGVTTALLQRHGIQVFSEESFSDGYHELDKM
ncbi:DUF523 domain-containing protein [Metabacillus litoralis]|uniref:DUF523 domain-containing protein n=1 Tax=Metabacillus litoralis TaxID=152268 RepID=UPI001CFE748A|nr:DUF523 domain-containing protein [Metabacillus litoralis]